MFGGWRWQCRLAQGVQLKRSGRAGNRSVAEFCPEMENETGIERIQQKYEEGFLNGAWVVVASTDDEEVNKKVYYDATKRGILVNVVDRPEFCSFIVPATINRGDLSISISTGGASPRWRVISERVWKNSLGMSMVNLQNSYQKRGGRYFLRFLMNQ